jgi:hypothetical protein
MSAPTTAVSRPAMLKISLYLTLKSRPPRNPPSRAPTMPRMMVATQPPP